MIRMINGPWQVVHWKNLCLWDVLHQHMVHCVVFAPPHQLCIYNVWKDTEKFHFEKLSWSWDLKIGVSDWLETRSVTCCAWCDPCAVAPQNADTKLSRMGGLATYTWLSRFGTYNRIDMKILDYRLKFHPSFLFPEDHGFRPDCSWPDLRLKLPIIPNWWCW